MDGGGLCLCRCFIRSPLNLSAFPEVLVFCCTALGWRFFEARPSFLLRWEFGMGGGCCSWQVRNVLCVFVSFRVIYVVCFSHCFVASAARFERSCYRGGDVRKGSCFVSFSVLRGRSYPVPCVYHCVFEVIVSPFMWCSPFDVAGSATMPSCGETHAYRREFDDFCVMKVVMEMLLARASAVQVQVSHKPVQQW